MTRLLCLPLLLTLACATMHPRPVPDQGSGGSVPHANYLLQSIEGQAMAPVGSPSWLGQAYSLTLNAANGSTALAIQNVGARFFIGPTRFLTDNGAALFLSGGPYRSDSSPSFTSSTASGNNGFQLTVNGARVDYGAGANDYIASDGTGLTTPGYLKVTGTTGNGTVTLVAGAGTATVFSGANCVCTDTTAAAAVKCSVSGTTLSVAGTGTDVIAYQCH